MELLVDNFNTDLFIVLATIATPSPFAICRRIRLLVPATRVMNVVTAVTTARRRSNYDDHLEHRNPGKGSNGYRHRAESAQKGPSCETGAPRCAQQGQVG